MIDIKKDFPDLYEEFLAGFSFNAANCLYSYDHILESRGDVNRVSRYSHDFDKVFSDAFCTTVGELDYDDNEEVDAYFEEHPEIDPDIDYEEVYDAITEALTTLAIAKGNLDEIVRNCMDYYNATRLYEKKEYSNATVALKDNNIYIFKFCDRNDEDAIEICGSDYSDVCFQKTVIECENRYQARGIFTFIKQENLLCYSVEEYAEAMEERSQADDVLDDEVYTSSYNNRTYDDDYER